MVIGTSLGDDKNGTLRKIAGTEGGVSRASSVDPRGQVAVRSMQKTAMSGRILQHKGNPWVHSSARVVLFERQIEGCWYCQCVMFGGWGLEPGDRISRRNDFVNSMGGWLVNVVGTSPAEIQ